MGRSAGTAAPNKGTTYPVEVLTEAEVMALMNACPQSNSGIRNRALIAVLWRTGLRLAEALSLYPKDVNQSLGALRVLHGKGNKARTVGMDCGGFEELNAWLEVRRDLAVGDWFPVFCTLDGEPMKQTYVRVMLGRLRDRAGLIKRVHPHGLRHTLAANLADEGVPVHLIQQQLGHANVATTSRYLQHVAPTQLITVMRNRRW